MSDGSEAPPTAVETAEEETPHTDETRQEAAEVWDAEADEEGSSEQAEVSDAQDSSDDGEDAPDSSDEGEDWDEGEDRNDEGEVAEDSSDEGEGWEDETDSVELPAAEGDGEGEGKGVEVVAQEGEDWDDETESSEVPAREGEDWDDETDSVELPAAEGDGEGEGERVEVVAQEGEDSDDETESSEVPAREGEDWEDETESSEVPAREGEDWDDETDSVELPAAEGDGEGEGERVEVVAQEGEDSDDETESSEVPAREGEDSDDETESTEASAREGEGSDDETEFPEASAREGEGSDDKESEQADEATSRELVDRELGEDEAELATDRWVAESILLLRGEQEILRAQDNEDGVQQLEMAIARMPAADELKEDPQGYLDAHLDVQDGERQNAQAAVAELLREDGDLEMDRRLAQDIAQLRREQEILREQGNVDGVERLERFLDHLPASEEIKRNPTDFLARAELDGAGDGEAGEAERPEGLRVLAQELSNSPQAVREAVAQATELAGGRCFASRNTLLNDNAQRLAPESSTYTMVMHADEDGTARAGGAPVSVEEVARMILDDPRAADARVVRLVACNTGGGDQSFAQQLADLVGKPVVAPAGTVWVSPEGQLALGDLALRQQPHGTVDAVNAGAGPDDEWLRFTPGRSDGEHAEPPPIRDVDRAQTLALPEGDSDVPAAAATARKAAFALLTVARVLAANPNLIAAEVHSPRLDPAPISQAQEVGGRIETTETVRPAVPAPIEIQDSPELPEPLGEGGRKKGDRSRGSVGEPQSSLGQRWRPKTNPGRRPPRWGRH